MKYNIISIAHSLLVKKIHRSINNSLMRKPFKDALIEFLELKEDEGLYLNKFASLLNRQMKKIPGELTDEKFVNLTDNHEKFSSYRRDFSEKIKRTLEDYVDFFIIKIFYLNEVPDFLKE